MPGGTCRELQREPTPEWTPDFATAVEIYNRALLLSGVDVNGYPQLTKLELVLEYMDYEVEDRTNFFRYVEALHGYNVRLRNEECRSKSK